MMYKLMDARFISSRKMHFNLYGYSRNRTNFHEPKPNVRSSITEQLHRTHYYIHRLKLYANVVCLLYLNVNSNSDRWKTPVRFFSDLLIASHTHNTSIISVLQTTAEKNALWLCT